MLRNMNAGLNNLYFSAVLSREKQQYFDTQVAKLEGFKNISWQNQYHRFSQTELAMARAKCESAAKSGQGCSRSGTYVSLSCTQI
jgi:hypothetical protein